LSAYKVTPPVGLSPTFPDTVIWILPRYETIQGSE
jgi:hypothetical protein